jgi:hypothetical protein
MSEEEQERSQGFRVTDRRRFSPESGEPQPTQTGESATDTQQEPAPPQAETQETSAPGRSHEAASDQIEIAFSSFILGLSTQALMSLGEIPAAPGQATRTDLTAARQMIDVLAMLQQKTSGNLDAGEGQMLENVLYDLRMRYVKLKRGGRPA